MSEQAATNRIPALQAQYRDTIRGELQKQLGCNVNAVPRVVKVSLNMGVGEAVRDRKVLEHAVADLTAIAGQKPLITKARKAIAGFNIREEFPIGTMVTLRGARMYEFLERLIHVGMPRMRDFRGIPARGFDGNGNFNFGINEQIIFPEIDYDKVDKIRGMNLTIATSARNDEEGRMLLDAFGFPFRK